jgi:hypothetical protein
VERKVLLKGKLYEKKRKEERIMKEREKKL